MFLGALGALRGRIFDRRIYWRFLLEGCMNHWLRRGAFVAAGLFAAQLLVRLYIYFRPMPTPPIFAFLLRSRWRRRYRDPRRTLAPLGLLPGMRVLEVGPGTGLFTLEASRGVGSGGRVVSVDLQPAMLRLLRKSLPAQTPENISLLSGDATELPLVGATVDAAYLIAVLPMIPNRLGALLELRRVLRPGGVLAVSEEIVAPEYVPPRVTERWLRQAGFERLTRVEGFWCYMITARPA